jgi:hypothetical protein
MLVLIYARGFTLSGAVSGLLVVGAHLLGQSGAVSPPS